MVQGPNSGRGVGPLHEFGPSPPKIDFFDVSNDLDSDDNIFLVKKILKKIFLS